MVLGLLAEVDFCERLLFGLFEVAHVALEQVLKVLVVYLAFHIVETNLKLAHLEAYCTLIVVSPLH